MSGDTRHSPGGAQGPAAATQAAPPPPEPPAGRADVQHRPAPAAPPAATAAAASPAVWQAATSRATGPGAVRVTDAERQAVVDQLTRATGDGLITLEELADAAGEAYAAVSRDDLEAVGRDLHLPMTPAEAARLAAGRAPAPRPERAPAGARRWVVAVMSGARRRGRWRVGRRVGAFAFWGGVKLDLRDAVLEAEHVEIEAWAVMGSVTVVVPEGIPVEVEGLVVMGGRSNHVRDVPPVPGAPTVTVRAYGLWGGVDVRSRPPRQAADGDGAPGQDQEAQAQGQAQNQTGQGRGQNQNQTGQGRGQGRRRRGPGPGWPAPPPDGPVRGGLVTVVCTDIVGSTRYADLLGDQRWRRVLLEHNQLVRDQLDRFGGTEVKTSGDGFLLTFTSARAALRFSVAVQDALATHREREPDAPVEVRIGVHAGEVERDGSDVIGRNVTIACRLCDLAAPGEVLASAVVADLTDSSSDLAFGEARELRLAGIERPVAARPATGR